jgi:hypothetical protein
MSIGIIFNLLSIYQFKTSSNGMFGIIYQIQIIMLLPLIGIDVGEDVIDFFRSISELMFTFKFIPDNFTFFGIDIYKDFDYPQSNWYLNLLDLTSGSSMTNTTSLLWIASILGVLILVTL